MNDFEMDLFELLIGLLGLIKIWFKTVCYNNSLNIVKYFSVFLYMKNFFYLKFESGLFASLKYSSWASLKYSSCFFLSVNN